jgi:phosphate transport system permease protein
MAVTLAAGGTPKMTLNPLESIQTMTAYIVQVATGDIEHGSISYHSLYAVGGLLFLITLAANLLSYKILKKYREEYE